MTPFRVALLLSLAALVGCRENPIIPEPNDRPVAVARVVLSSGPSDETTDPVLKQDLLKFEFDGAPLDVKLDGMASSDKDGKVRKYVWQSATLISPDAGAAQPMNMKDPIWMPDGAQKGWPADEANPTVTITAAGIYAFNLWVTDDVGSVSEPDTIKFTVGSAVDPAVAACVESVFPDVTPECAECMCSKGMACQTAVAETACGADCWGLIRCIGAMCPMFMPGGDTSCVTGMCMPFLAGAGAAGPAGMCVRMCLDVCAAAPMP